MTKNNKKNELTQKPLDYINTIVKGAISAIPLAGGPLAEIFSMLIVPPISKRRDKLIIQIVEGLKNLEKKIDKFNIENLANNELFITTLLHGFQIALKNHQILKIEAIKNSILNSAINDNPDENINLMFLHYIDIFTAGHINLLSFFHNPEKWIEKKQIILNSGGYQFSTFFKIIFKDFEDRKDYYYQIIADLNNNRLIRITVLSFNNNDIFKIKHFLNSYTTSFGKKFVKFISDPT